MLRSLPWFLALALLLVALPATAADEEETGITAGLIDDGARRGEIDRYYKDVLGASHPEDAVEPHESDVIDPANAWTVENFVVEVDSLKITFESGEFFPRTEIEGEVYGAVYLGTGRWEFATDISVEQDELEYYAGQRSLDQTFTNMFLQFSPDHLAKFKTDAAQAASGDAKKAKEAASFWKKRREAQPSVFDLEIAWFHIEGHEYFDRLMLEANLDKVKKGKGFFVYEWDIHDREEVKMWRYRVNAFDPDVVDSEWLCHFMQKDDRERLTAREKAYKESSRINVEHVDGDFEIYKDEDTLEWGLRGDVTVTYVPLIRDLKTVSFALSDVRIAGVLDKDDNVLPFIFKSGLLITELPEPAKKGEKQTLRMKYEGEIVTVIKQPEPEMGLQGQSDTASAEVVFMSIIAYTLLGQAWYPWNYQDGRDQCTWEWRVTIPKPMMVASSGVTTSQVEEGKFYKYTIKQGTPISQGGMIFGRYTPITDDINEGKRPFIRVLAFPGYMDSAHEILEQSHDIIEYFEELYQVPFPYPELEIGQMPFMMGFAYMMPGLIEMSGEAYLSKEKLLDIYNYRNPFIRDAFLPHEIAHCWWAGHVADRTDHDRWMLEMGAEYSAALFHEAAKGPEGYNQALKMWRNQRNAKNTKKTMPLWVAFAHNGQGDKRHNSTVYGRGPLLLHELREALGYEKLVSVLRAILQEWGGDAISTEDFQMVLEKATGMSFEQFFELYVYGNEALGSAPEDMLQPKK